jgi:outer membrane protein assembly factor BamB
LVLILAIVLAGLPALPVRAQLSEEDANRVASSTVMLSVRIWQEENGVRQPFADCALGSGSVISADGRLILTNSHVVAGFDLAKSFAETEEAELSQGGRQVELWVDERIVVSIVNHRRGVPVPLYGARSVTSNPTLDLAVLRITGDAPPGFEHELPIDRRPLEFGSSINADRVTLFGYPAVESTPTEEAGCAPIPSGTIKSYEGAVPGFSGSALDVLEVDATASFGNSGGSAVDDRGRLVGVPTRVRSIAGGGVVEVIPIERALDLLTEVAPEEFGSSASPTPAEETALTRSQEATATVAPGPTQAPTAAPTNIPVPPTNTPMPPAGTPMSPTATGPATEPPRAARFPAYDIGESVVTTDTVNLREEATTESAIVESLPAGITVEISGTAVTFAAPELNWWPVTNPSTGLSGFVREDLLERPAPEVPVARGNPAQTGEMPGPGPAGEPVIRWRAPIPGDGDLTLGSGLAIAGGAVYFTTLDIAGGRALTVHALDAATGEQRWRVQPTTSTPIGNPAVAGDLVYVAGEDGVYALDAVTGQERWRTETSGGGGNPVVVGGVVYVDSFFGVHALDAVTGEERWRSAISDEVPAIPAVAGGVVYIDSDDVSSTDNRGASVHAFDAVSGEERWRAVFGDWVNSIAVAEGLVYAVGHDGFVYALDAATGEERWKSSRIGDRVVGNLAVADGAVYVTGHMAEIEASSVYALDGATGEELWSEPGGRRTVGTLVVADSVVYVGDFTGGNVYALDAATGAEQWRLALGVDISSLAVVSGIMYVGSDSGYIFAIGGND